MCNLHNQNAISTITVQYQQSDCNLHNQTVISQNKSPRHMPDTLWRIGAPMCKLPIFCNLSNQTAILLHCSQITQIALNCKTELQSQIAVDCSGLFLDYTDYTQIALFCNPFYDHVIHVIEVQSLAILKSFRVQMPRIAAGLQYLEE